MTRFAVRLLTLGFVATALGAVPMIAPAKAATDASSAVKKKHRKISPAGSEAQAPKSSSQYPPNMSEDPSRRVSY
jgi:hypothetical protein